MPHLGFVEQPGSSGVQECGGAEKSRRSMISRTSSRGRDIVNLRVVDGTVSFKFSFSASSNSGAWYVCQITLSVAGDAVGGGLAHEAEIEVN